MHVKHRLTLWGLILLAFGSFAGTAMGLEGGKPTGPIGGTDVGSAFLPPPGLYGGLVGAYIPYGDLRTSAGRYAGSGDMSIGGVGLVYVYDAKLWGGSLASSISAGYAKDCYGLSSAPSKTCSSSLTDVYSDLIEWSYFFADERSTNEQAGLRPIPYGLAVLVAFGVSFPTGDFDASKGTNVGANFYDFAPSVGITYTVPSLLGSKLGQATEFSARAFYHDYTENDTTQYQTGNIFSVDFAITQRLDQWQYGLAGNYWAQIQDDKRQGVTIRDNRAMASGIGPFVAYDFRKAGRLWNLAFKWNFRVDSDNGPDAAIWMVRLTSSFSR